MVNEEKSKSSLLTYKNLFWVLVVVFVAVLSLGGGYGYKLHEDLTNTLIKENDSIINVSIIKQDSLINVANEGLIYGDEQRYLFEQIQIKNNRLYEIIREKELLLNIRDTSFGNNARIITNSINRYYSENDTIR